MFLLWNEGSFVGALFVRLCAESAARSDSVLWIVTVVLVTACTHPGWTNTGFLVHRREGDGGHVCTKEQV